MAIVQSLLQRLGSFVYGIAVAALLAYLLPYAAAKQKFIEIQPARVAARCAPIVSQPMNSVVASRRSFKVAAATFSNFFARRNATRSRRRTTNSRFMAVSTVRKLATGKWKQNGSLGCHSSRWSSTSFFYILSASSLSKRFPCLCLCWRANEKKIARLKNVASCKHRWNENLKFPDRLE